MANSLPREPKMLRRQGLRSYLATYYYTGKETIIDMMVLRSTVASRLASPFT